MASWKQQIRVLPKITKKLFTIKKILLMLSILIVLAAAFWIHFTTEIWRDSEANKRTVEAYLVHMSRENYEMAYSLFAERYKKEENFETFKQTVSPFKHVFSDYKPNSFAIQKTTRFFNPLEPAALRHIGEITYQDGEKAPVTAIFIWEHGTWVLYIMEFNSPNSRIDSI